MDNNSERPTLILVEGVADQQFLIHYLRHLYGMKFSATASQSEVYVAGPVTIQYTNGWKKIKALLPLKDFLDVHFVSTLL